MKWLEAPWVQQVWHDVVPRLPRLGIALLILVGGWLIAYVIQKLVYGGLKRTTIDDRLAEAVGVETGGDEGYRIERIISKIIYYLLFLFVLVAFFSYLRIDAVTAPLVTVLNEFAGAVPNLLKALVIGFGGFLLATAVRKLIVAGLDKVDFEARMNKLAGEEEPPAAAVEEEAEEEGKRKKKKKRKKARPEQPLTRTLGDVAYWFIIIVAAIPVLEALQIGALAAPLSAAFGAVATYLPKIAAAAVLLVIGYLLARVVRAVVAGVLEKVGLDAAMARLGFGRITREQRLSRILGTITMAFVLLHFAISAVGRLEIKEISAPLTLMLDRIYIYLPKLLIGAVLMAIGVLVARVAGNVAARLLAAMGFNTLMMHIGVYKEVTPEAKRQEEESRSLVDRRLHAQAEPEVTTDEEDEDDLLAGHGTEGIRTPADIAGVLVGAIVVLLFLRQVLGTMQLDGLASMLDGLIAYLPNAIVAAILVGAGLWAGGWAHKRVDELTRGTKDRLLGALGSVAHVAIVAFAAMMALQQLGVGRQLIAIAFALILGAVCLALALAFGLGGRDTAAKIVQKEYDQRQRGPR